METIFEAWKYAQENGDKLVEAFQTHLLISVIALIVGMAICIPLGIVCAKNEKVSGTIMGIFNSLRVIPSLAILVIVLPILGTGINTFIGFREIDPAVKEAALGMGMNEKQILRKIEFPLALPLMIAGCRTAAVEVVASATLAAFIGGGGLGQFIINGLGMYNIPLLLVGAIPVALLSIFSEISFAVTERFVTRYQRD